MEAREYLMQVRKLDKMIENKMVEKEQWKAIATNTTARTEGERVQSSCSQEKMADAVCRYVSIEEEINQCIDSMVDIKQEIIKTIEQLPTDLYDILHKMYIGLIDQKTRRIYYLQLEDIATKYDKSYTWAKGKHGRALKSVQKILDERQGLK